MNKLLAQIGTINPPSGTVTIGEEDPTAFVGGFIQAGLQLLIIVAFIVTLLWTIFAGFRFLTSGGDPKNTGQAWSQIYYGLIGMLVVLSSFAIIKLVETFFGISIISGGSFQFPSN